MSVLFAVMLAVLPLLTHQQCWSPGGEESYTNARQDLLSGQQQFSLDLFKDIAQHNVEENVFISPNSIYKAILLACFGTASHTEIAVKKALHIPDDLPKSEVMKAFMFEKLLQAARSHNSSGGYHLSISNHIFYATYLELKPCIAIVFNEETTAMDFAKDQEAARLAINEWVEKHTEGHIKDLVQEDKIQPDTQIVLVNTAYFKGEWKTGFKITKQEAFHLSSTENVTVDMMRQTGTFNYLLADDLASHVLELPYKGDAVSMYVLMPRTHKVNGSCGIEHLFSLLTVERFQNLIDSLEESPNSFNLGLPKFTVDKRQNLNTVFSRLGVGDLLKDTADLSDLSESRITLEDVEHKAKIEVDEQGTTAAAATIMFGTRSSRPMVPKVTVNKPFVYFLYDKAQKTIHFAGVFRSPEK